MIPGVSQSRKRVRHLCLNCDDRDIYVRAANTKSPLICFPFSPTKRWPLQSIRTLIQRHGQRMALYQTRYHHFHHYHCHHHHHNHHQTTVILDVINLKLIIIRGEFAARNSPSGRLVQNNPVDRLALLKNGVLMIMTTTMMMMILVMIFHLKDLNGDPFFNHHQKLWQLSILKIEFLRPRLG